MSSSYRISQTIEDWNPFVYRIKAMATQIIILSLVSPFLRFVEADFYRYLFDFRFISAIWHRKDLTTSYKYTGWGFSAANFLGILALIIFKIQYIQTTFWPKLFDFHCIRPCISIWFKNCTCHVCM